MAPSLGSRKPKAHKHAACVSWGLQLGGIPRKRSEGAKRRVVSQFPGAALMTRAPLGPLEPGARGTERNIKGAMSSGQPTREH